MSYITRIRGMKIRNIESIDIDLTPPEGAAFRHLIVTGPNGSGKSGLLEAIVSIGPNHGGRSSPVPGAGQEFVGTLYTSIRQESDFMVEISYSGPAWIERSSGHLAFLWSSAKRGQEWKSHRVDGPRRLKPNDLAAPEGATQFLRQFLVNRKTEAAFALSDGDNATAAAIEDWFESLRLALATLMSAPNMKMTFNRQAYTFDFERGDGYRFNLNELSDGYGAALALVGDLLMRVQACRDKVGDQTLDPEGIAIVDELEAHLHLELQEQILPLLTTMFPKIQFIVATHSPAVICSVDNAIVYDLERREATPSAEYVGIRYGTLMREHFGLSADYDLRTERELDRLRTLWKMSPRTGAEEAELRQLASALAGRSYGIAREIQLRLELADESGSSAA